MPIGVCDSPYDLFQSIIRSAIASDSPAESLEFLENSSTLVIKSKFQEKPVIWKIQMEQVDSISDKKAEALTKEVKELTARLEKLPGAGKQFQRLQFAAVTHPNFTLFSARTKVTKTGNQNGPWQGFLSEQPISAVGNKFVVEFDKIGFQCVGVSKPNTSTNKGLQTHAGAWMLFNYSETLYYFYNSGNRIELGTKTKINSGSRLTVSVSPTGMLLFELEGTLLHTFKLHDPKDLHAAVDMHDAGQSATFV